MADERLRRAERRAASGEAADLERLVVERLRSGTISRAALEVAAYLGHEAARDALGEDGLVRRPPKTGLVGFLRQLPGEASAAAGLLALVDRLLPACPDPAARAARDAVAAWLAGPSDDARKAARKAGKEAATAHEVAPASPEVARRRAERQAAWDRLSAARLQGAKAYQEAFDATEVIAREERARPIVDPAAVVLDLCAKLAGGVAREPPSLYLPIEAAELAARVHGLEPKEARALAGEAALRLCLDRTGGSDAGPARPAAPAHGLTIPPALEPAVARAVLAAAEAAFDAGGTKAERARLVIRAWLEALGWTANHRGNLTSPDGQRRVKLKARVLELLERDPAGQMVRKASTANQQTLLSTVADELLAAARRA
jgi:hypothetical protein